MVLTTVHDSRVNSQRDQLAWMRCYIQSLPGALLCPCYCSVPRYHHKPPFVLVHLRALLLEDLAEQLLDRAEAKEVCIG
jgi:hypothetical protein